MNHAAITSYVDVAQLVLYVFWIAFAGLIYYLQRESKREGFPLENHTAGGRMNTTPGLIGMPSPKTYKLANGTEVHSPNLEKSPQKLNARPANKYNGAPLDPIGNPLLAGVGPGAWADRADHPEMTTHNETLLAPLRIVKDYKVSPNDINPIGLPVVGADGATAGKVVDIWLDRGEMVFRHIELEVRTSSGTNNGTARRVLVPINFVRIHRGMVKVESILSTQFADVPSTKHPDQITMLEEEKVMAYYGAGTLYATPQRAEVWL
jgi:photosynthetic reaction center H subunit